MAFIIAMVLALVAVAALALSFGSGLKDLEESESDDYFEASRIGRINEENAKTRMLMRFVTFVAGAAALVFMAFSMVFTQDAGEVKVLRNWGGSIVSQPIVDAGFHLKAPWQDVIAYDTRNNVISYVADGGESYDGGTAAGPQVTINDASGASANIDIQVNYSLDPKSAVGLYRDYGKQENFVKAVAAVDVRSIPREVAGDFDTLQLLTRRGEYADAVEKALKEKWAGLGLEVTQVSVQEIRYPETITAKYAESQAAEVERQTALNQQETAKVKAETKKIEAQGTADANKVLDESLTDKVLMQNYTEALKNADSLTVVPDGSQPIIKTE